jgi:hypothetical protein
MNPRIKRHAAKLGTADRVEMAIVEGAHSLPRRVVRVRKGCLLHGWKNGFHMPDSIRLRRLWRVRGPGSDFHEWGAV